ncbi:MAG: RecX family transcriptional regulator, partial [Erysipelotrichaceae bacterium]|nr:RecX family transcriptional regulator [Erysipelotrichaceae bacterium]
KASKLAEKYAGTIANKSRMAKKQAILNKLVSAGYSYEMSRSAVNELDINVDNEIELLKKEYEKARNRYEKKYSGYERRQKIYASLMNKGFSSEDINRIMEV